MLVEFSYICISELFCLLRKMIDADRGNFIVVLVSWNAFFHIHRLYVLDAIQHCFDWNGKENEALLCLTYDPTVKNELV